MAKMRARRIGRPRAEDFNQVIRGARAEDQHLDESNGSLWADVPDLQRPRRHWALPVTFAASCDSGPVRSSARQRIREMMARQMRHCARKLLHVCQRGRCKSGESERFEVGHEEASNSALAMTLREMSMSLPTCPDVDQLCAESPRYADRTYIIVLRFAI